MARSSLAICLLLLVTLSAVYEVQGTFLLRHHMRKFPRRARLFRPFACRGMLMFVNALQQRCPLTSPYKNFFGKLTGYISFLNTASASSNYDVQLKGQAEGLNSAMSQLTGTGGSSADSTKVIDTLMSMGKTLGDNQRSDSILMRFAQRRELALSMAKWAQVISQFVANTALKSGTTIDISSLGIDNIDAEMSTTNTPATPTTATPTTATPTTATPTTATPTTATPTTATPTTGTPDTAGTTNTGTTSTGTTNIGTTNTGTTTTSCTTGACPSNGGVNVNGGSTLKGSMNFQSSGQKSSDQTTTAGST